MCIPQQQSGVGTIVYTLYFFGIYDVNISKQSFS